LFAPAAKSQIMGLCPANNIGQHTGDTSPTNHKEQKFSTVAALLESAILSGEIIPRISADNERFKFFRPFQQVLSALILSCGLASINHSVLVMSSTRGPSLASKEIDRKNDCKREIT